jgi:hypothetical protein
MDESAAPRLCATACQRKNIRKVDESLGETCEELDGVRVQLQKRLKAIQSLRDGVGSLVFTYSTSVVRS